LTGIAYMSVILYSKDTSCRQIHRLRIHKEVALSTILYSINQTASSDSFDLINTNIYSQTFLGVPHQIINQHIELFGQH